MIVTARTMYLWSAMATPASKSRARIAPDVDPVSLFAEVEERFHDHFDILQLVAASPERALFLVRDKTLKRRVALRIQLTPQTPERRWFECETQLIAALDHPVLRPVYVAGSVGDWVYRVSKWIDGEAVLDAVQRAPRPIPTVLQLGRDVTSFLEYVHTQRIVLRQLAPATIIVENTGRYYVTDLRYANICLDVAQPSQDPDALPFLAPEIRAGQPPEPASDIYSAGALLYFAVTGRAPEAEAIQAPRAIRPACPQALERVILRALSSDPDRRYLTAAEMADDLVSELGDFDVPISVAPALGGATEDARVWEKRLRRALGDDYELLEELGAGSFGRVYLVRDLALERPVALKVLHPYLTADPNVVERFRREAQLAAQLNHANIVEIFDIGGRAGLLWYTMAYVSGPNLAQVVEQEGPLPVARVVEILEDALAGMQHAHEHGLVHRDLKPENLLIEERTGEVRITDFGLALAFQAGDHHGGASSRSGTPEFASPEQLLGEPVDHRADLYSLTLAAYYALTGQSPFASTTLEAVVARQAAGLLPDVLALREDVPKRLVHVLAQGAERVPADRFTSAEDYARALRAAGRSRGAVLRRLVGRMLGGRGRSRR